MSGSLSAAKGFVKADAFQLSALTVFQPEQTDLEDYSFLPWVRTGLAAQLADPQGADVRASVAVTVNVDDDAGGSTPVTKTLILRGPGDVLAIDPTQIVRRYPQPNSFTAEETYLAHIEFDRPELPWLFTPFKPQGDRLAPWIALVVVEERSFQVRQGNTGLPLQFTTKKGELQPLEDSWAWAHAQISGKPAGGVSVEDRLTDAYAPVNLSRLLCPRKLDQNTNYVACVVPAFDCGARAGLGLSGGTLAPAWKRAPGDDDQEITLPLYDYWRFRIAPAGDFESLATKLVGLPAPWQIGRRTIDFSNPRGGMAPLAADEAGRVQALKCALHSPAPAPGDLDSAAWTNPKRTELMAQVNLADAAAGDTANATDLPRVSPRLYARYQRAQSRLTAIDDADWFSQLNTTPTHRIVAGLGTRVVQKDQEALMQAAWAQVGEIDKANQRLALAQFARFTAESLHKNHFSRLALGDLAQVTRAVQGKLCVGGAALTLAGTASRSATAPAALTGAFRRVTRLRGPLTRFYGNSGAQAVRALVASGDSFQDFRRTYTEPDGIVGLSASAIAHFSPATIAAVMKMPAAAAAAALQANVIRDAAKPSVADQLLTPRSTWRIPAGSIDLGSIGATRLLDLVEAVSPATATDNPARTEALAGILAGVSTSGITEAATRAGKLAEKIGVRLPAVSTTTTTTGTTITSRLEQAVRETTINVTGPHAGLTAQPPIAAVTLPAGAVVNTLASRAISVKINLTGATTFQQVAVSLSAFATGIGTVSLPTTPDLPKLSVARTQLLAVIHPKTTVTAYMVARLGSLPSWLPKDWFDDGFVQPIMQAPVFTRPMYEALDSYDREWLIPGLGTMQQTDLVTLLETNPAFIEAFLVGLSDEMGRELLWRGYPTDSRATYFKRFWTPDQDELGQQIHLFSHTPLATHIAAAAGGAAGRLVLLVRGELIRRYPHAIMLAQQQIGKDAHGNPTFAVPPAPGAPGSILFHVPLAPDIFLTGFLLTEADLKNAGAAAHPWWFIISEHPTAPRFGLDLPSSPLQAAPAGMTRDQAKWANFGPLAFSRFLSTSAANLTVKEPLPSAETTAWNAAALHGGATARVLLQNPFRAAWDGLKLIGPAKS